MTHRGGRKKGPRGATNPYRDGSPRAIAWTEGWQAARITDVSVDVQIRYRWLRPDWKVRSPAIARFPGTGDLIERFIATRPGYGDVEIACWIQPDGRSVYRMIAPRVRATGEARDQAGVNTFLLSIERSKDAATSPGRKDAIEP